MEKNIFYIAGLPRSGSTLLTNILAQNDSFHVTSTNDLVNLISQVKNTWMDLDGFKAQGLKNVMPNIRSTMEYMLYGFHEKAITENKIIFDKSRGWLNNIDLIEELTGKKAKIIVPVRDVKDIASSFEKLQRKNVLHRNKIYGSEFNQMDTSIRTETLISTGGVIGSAVSFLRDAMQMNLMDRVLVVPFKSLTFKPEETMKQLHDSLGLKQFEYDFDNVENKLAEDDLVYGLSGLHDIKSKVFPVESDAESILGKALCNKIDDNFKDINELAK